MKSRKRFSTIPIYMILSITAFFTVIPFLLMILTSFKSKNDLVTRGPLAMPSPLEWNNYVRIWNVGNFVLYFRNSIIVTSICVLGVVILSLLGAYAFSYLRFKGKGFFFSLVLLGLMIPLELIIIPLFYNLRMIGLLNTIWALVFPLVGLILPFAIILLRGFMRDIPKALQESAYLDGCNELQSLIYIITPLVKPALVSVVIFSAIWSWNNFMLPTVLIQSDELRTLPTGLSYFTDKYTADYTMIATSASISAFPTILVFVILQRKFIKGMVMGALKE